MTIICLGEMLIDRVVASAGQQQDFPGGAPANVAIALTRLGVPTTFVGAIGSDPLGASLKHELQTAGVDCAGLQESHAPTRVVEVQCTAAGDRTFGGFVGGITTEFADAQLSAADLPHSCLQTAQGIVMGTLGMAYPATRAAMQRAAALTQSAGGQVVIDVNWRPTFWPDPSLAGEPLHAWLRQANWLKVSADEALALWGTSDLDAIAAQFPEAGILLTDGAQSCRYRIAGLQGEVPTFVVTSVETTGAGDAFLAGFIYQLRRWHWQLRDAAAITQAITFAHAMGALTTLKPGAIAAQPTRDELLSFLQDRTGCSWSL